MDYNVIDALAVAFGRKSLGVQQQPPEEGVHGFLLILRNLIFNLDGIGIRDRNLKIGAACQDKKASQANSHTRGMEIFCYFPDFLQSRNHHRFPYRVICGAFWIEGLVVV